MEDISYRKYEVNDYQFTVKDSFLSLFSTPTSIFHHLLHTETLVTPSLLCSCPPLLYSEARTGLWMLHKARASKWCGARIRTSTMQSSSTSATSSTLESSRRSSPSPDRPSPYAISRSAATALPSGSRPFSTRIPASLRPTTNGSNQSPILSPSYV